MSLAPSYPTQGSPDPRLPEPLAPEHLRRLGKVSRQRLNLALLCCTFLTTSYWGFIQYQEFYVDELVDLSLNPFAAPDLMLRGLPFGVAVIAFLMAHEMGHYFACRLYGIRATLPYFIPIPPIPPFVLLPGTMGAVIRILTPIVSRRALFDIAVAGPLAGFVVALPILAAGLSLSRVVDPAELEQLVERGGFVLKMGEPLLWQPLQDLFAPPMSAGQDLLTHPLAFVGWFALLVTAMNLLPVGQLDGGHLIYVFLPGWHRTISRLVLVGMLYAGWQYFTGWFLFALVVSLLGTRHPQPLQFDQPLGALRWSLGLLASLILLTCFMLAPVEIQLGL